MKSKFPNWIFKTRNEMTVAFKDIRCVEGFKIAVRVGLDGVNVFEKNSGFIPNSFYMNDIEFASLEDFKGSGGEGFKSFEVGCLRFDGTHWFSDCMYEPGILDEDFEEIKSLQSAFYQRYLSIQKPTQKQLIRINKMMELRGREFVHNYFYSKFPNGDFDTMTRESAQKVITGLRWIEPHEPLRNVYINHEWIS